MSLALAPPPIPIILANDDAPLRHSLRALLGQGAAGDLIKAESPRKIVEAAQRFADSENPWFSEEVTIPLLH
jgi:hypothetical protein